MVLYIFVFQLYPWPNFPVEWKWPITFFHGDTIFFPHHLAMLMFVVLLSSYKYNQCNNFSFSCFFLQVCLHFLTPRRLPFDPSFLGNEKPIKPFSIFNGKNPNIAFYYFYYTKYSLCSFLIVVYTMNVYFKMPYAPS